MISSARLEVMLKRKNTGIQAACIMKPKMCLWKLHFFKFVNMEMYSSVNKSPKILQLLQQIVLVAGMNFR